MSEHADRRVATFSKGMRQKVAIARALLHDPEVIYLDEPTSGLDPSAAKTVRDFVAGLRSLGRSIVVCTHNLDEAERLCDRIGSCAAPCCVLTPPQDCGASDERPPFGSSSTGRAAQIHSSSGLPTCPS